MGRNSKSLSLALVLIMVTLCITIVETVQAQSTKPLPPKFSITTVPGINLVIENQAFANSTSVNSIVYYWKVKDHYSEGWATSNNFQRQSNSKTTIIGVYPATLYMLWVLGTSTLLDFQVQAATGNYTAPDKFGPPTLGPTFVKSEESDWSSTQTITNPKTTSSPSPSPVPEFSWLAIPPLFAIVLSVAFAIRRQKSAKAR